MNLAKKIIAVFLIIAMIFCFAACSNDEAENALDIGTINMGFISTGDVEDDAYSALHYNSFKTAYGLAGAGDGQVTLEENVPAGNEKAMNNAVSDLLARGARLIVGINPGYYDAFVKYANENKNVFFAVIGDYAKKDASADNLSVISINTLETEYLEGIAAGLSTENGKIAYVADMTFGIVQNAEINAFTKGVKSVKGDAKVYLISTEDVKAGVEKALAEKCDVVYSRNYVVDEETGETFFKVPESVGSVMTLNKITKDGNEFITGTAINADFIYTKVVLNTVNETFGDLTKFTWGIKDGAIDISPVADAKVKTAVDKAKAQFMDGKDVIGADAAELSDKLVSDIAVL